MVTEIIGYVLVKEEELNAIHRVASDFVNVSVYEDDSGTELWVPVTKESVEAMEKHGWITTDNTLMIDHDGVTILIFF